MVNIKLISFSFLKFLSAAIFVEYHLKGTVSWDFMHNVYMYVFSNYVDSLLCCIHLSTSSTAMQTYCNLSMRNHIFTNTVSSRKKIKGSFLKTTFSSMQLFGPKLENPFVAQSRLLSMENSHNWTYNQCCIL